MTAIDMRVLTRGVGHTPIPLARARVRVQAVWAKNKPVANIGPTGPVFSDAVELQVRDGELERLLPLVPTDGTFCYRWEISSPDVVSIFVIHTVVPESPTPIKFGDLQAVDPDTFQPTGTVVAAWEAVVAEVMGARDVTVAAARSIADDARGARESATAAFASAGSAASSAVTAGNAATESVAALGLAANAATAAQSAASSAGGSAGDAHASADAAGQSKNAAGASAGSAETSAQSAAGSATTAAQKATDAASSATTASQAATTATGAATDAAASKTAAQTSATNADARAKDAATSATAAAGSATTADQRATAAGQSATAAASSATSADGSKTAAQTARTGAETAQTGAQTARIGAETARTGAETAQTGASGSATAAAGSASASATSAADAQAARNETIVSVGTMPDWGTISATLTQAATRSAYLRRRLTGNPTIGFAAGVANVAYSCTLELLQDGTGGRVLTLANVATPYGAAIPLSTAAGAIDIIRLEWNGTRWSAFLAGVQMSVPTSWVA